MNSQFCFLIFVLMSTGTLLAQANPCNVLPPDAGVVLQRQFPTLRPKNLADLSGYDKKLWLETHPKACPGIASGHFEKPGRAGYAILLVARARDGDTYKVAVLSKVETEYLVRLLEEGRASADSGLVISKERPGSYSEFDSGKSVHVLRDGVNVEWLEKSSVLYYWSHGQYRSIQTSD
jgi:hypothetical protein